MAKVKASSTSGSSRKIRPALSPEARENQLISLAVDLVEQRLIDGTASAQEVTHFLKLGSMRERLEREKLARENALLSAKVEAIESGKELKELYKGAIDAMRIYAGYGGEYNDDNDY